MPTAFMEAVVVTTSPDFFTTSPSVASHVTLPTNIRMQAGHSPSSYGIIVLVFLSTATEHPFH